MKASPIPKHFTLLELLIVVSIIAILAGLLLPVLGRAQERSRRSACSSNLKQIGVAMKMYASDFDGFYSYMPHQGPNVEGWQLVEDNYLPLGKTWSCPSAISHSLDPADPSFDVYNDFSWGWASSAKPNYRLDASWKWRDDGRAAWVPDVDGFDNGYLLSNYQANNSTITMIPLNNQADPADCVLGSDMNLMHVNGIKAVSHGTYSNFLLVDGHVTGFEGPSLYGF